MLLDLQRKSYRIFHIPCSGLLASVFGKISHRSRAQPHRINMTILVKAKRQFYADVWKGMNPFFDVRSYYRHTDTQLTSWGSMSSTHASAAGGCSSSPPSASSVFSTREAVAVPSEPAAACASNHHGSIININLFESCWAANSTWLGHVNHAWRSTKRCETRWSCQSSNWSAFSLQVFEQLCLHSRLRYHVSKAILKKDGTSWSFTSATETMATASFTNWIEEPSSKCWRPISSNNDWWLKPQCERYEIVHWARSCYLSRLLWMNDQATNLRPWDHGKYLDRNPYL